MEFVFYLLLEQIGVFQQQIPAEFARRIRPSHIKHQRSTVLVCEKLERNRAIELAEAGQGQLIYTASSTSFL